MRIIGIDPGLRRTGFGVVECEGARLRYIASGTIIVPSEQALAQRLKVILDNIREIVTDTRPDVSAIEKVFVNANPTSTLLLGQARGAALCGLADSRLPVHEYTALQIKKAVVGNGHADKTQVQEMVKRLLTLDDTPTADSADALACAICHAHIAPLKRRLEQVAGLHAGRRTGRLRGGRLVG